MLYCFMSSDVKIALAKRYYRFKVRWQSRNLKPGNQPSILKRNKTVKVRGIFYLLD